MKSFFYFLIFITLFGFFKTALASSQNIVWIKSIAKNTATKFNLNYYSGLKALKYKQNIILASSSGHISCFNAKTAWRQWTQTIKNEKFYFSILNKNILFLGSLTGRIFAFNLDTQKILWQKQLSTKTLYATTIYRQYLLLVSDTGQLLAINKNTANTVWFRQVFANSLKRELLDVRNPNAVFVVLKKHTLYVRYFSKILAFNLRSKKVQFKKKYNKRSKRARYFKNFKYHNLYLNKKQHLAGPALKDKNFIYLYTQSNSLIKILFKN